MLCFFPQLLSDPTHPPNPCSLSLKQTKSKEEKKKTQIPQNENQNIHAKD